jgi:hypothetical protein
MTDTMLAALFHLLEADIHTAEEEKNTAWVKTLTAALHAIRPMRDALADVTDVGS